MTKNTTKEELKNYKKVEDINNIYMIAYVLEASSNYGLKYIRKGNFTNANLQKIFNEGKEMFNNMDCSKFKIVLFNKENNEFIKSYSPDLNNFEERYNFEDICDEIKAINELNRNKDITSRVSLENLCNNQIINICERNNLKTIKYIPDIENHTLINSSKRILDKEVFFEDGILIEDGEINAILNMNAGQVEKNFGLKDLIYDEDYYDVYLDYNPEKDSCEITIVAVIEEDRKYYTYLPKPKEKEMLKKSLEKYVKDIEGKSIQDLLVEEQELEKE